jgi:tetratricopeptide (TPR) repeat protein
VPRIEELERRVREDPASITFGALAEEYRRAGRLEEAIATCRAGLERHPGYLSARVTLGRALQELQHSSEARVEFEYVLSIAPDNLAALRGLADLQDGTEAVSPPPPTEAAPPPAGEPDLSALDASLETAAAAHDDAGSSQRAAQIERLEIWLARLEELRRDGSSRPGA